MKKYLIVGSNFDNKGAEAMMFACIDAIKANNPENVVYVLLSKDSDIKINAEKVEEYIPSKLYACGGIYKIIGGLTKIVDRKKRKSKLSELSELIKTIDCIIDVSGYNLSSDWSFWSMISYMSMIMCGVRRNIPVYLFPQSFGPFNYKGSQKIIDSLSKKYLPKVKRIYVREADGEKHLANKYKLSNVKKIYDMVLQHKTYNVENIFSETLALDDIPVLDKSKHYVGIVPNKRSYRAGSKDMVYELYVKVIKKLNSIGKSVVIIPHTGKDMEIGKEIIKLCDGMDVSMLDREYLSFQYENIFNQCDYIIGSRFHSIVHSYKANTPCLILGWAVKYLELADLFGQKKYVYSIKDSELHEYFLAGLDMIEENFENEKKVIADRLSMIDEDVCFKELFEDMKEV